MAESSPGPTGRSREGRFGVLRAGELVEGRATVLRGGQASAPIAPPNGCGAALGRLNAEAKRLLEKMDGSAPNELRGGPWGCAGDPGVMGTCRMARVGVMSRVADSPTSSACGKGATGSRRSCEASWPAPQASLRAREGWGGRAWVGEREGEQS